MQRLEVEKGDDHKACQEKNGGVTDGGPGGEADHGKQEDSGHLVIVSHGEKVLPGFGKGFVDEAQKTVEKLFEPEEEEDGGEAGQVKEETADRQSGSRVFDDLEGKEPHGQ